MDKHRLVGWATAGIAGVAILTPMGTASATPVPIAPGQAGPGARTAVPPDNPATVNFSGPITPEVQPNSKAEAARAANKQAQAASLDLQCIGAYNCMWSGSYYTGAVGHLAGANQSWGVFSQPYCAQSGNPDGNWKNCASSAAARVPNGFSLYRDVNYGGGGVWIPNGDEVGYLTQNSINNDTESNQ